MPPKLTAKWMETLTGNSRRLLGRGIERATAVGASFAATLLAAGCSRAPSFNILGSFFPAWIGCGIIGILLATAVRVFFVRIKLEDELLMPLILVYPCLTAFFTFTLWLLFFS
jgi:YtcA family